MYLGWQFGISNSAAPSLLGSRAVRCGRLKAVESLHWQKSQCDKKCIDKKREGSWAAASKGASVKRRSRPTFVKIFFPRYLYTWRTDFRMPCRLLFPLWGKDTVSPPSDKLTGMLPPLHTCRSQSLTATLEDELSRSRRHTLPEKSRAKMKDKTRLKVSIWPTNICIWQNWTHWTKIGQFYK